MKSAEYSRHSLDEYQLFEGQELIKRLLSKQGWFKQVSEEKISQIVDQSEVRRYSAEEFIYMVGDLQNSIFCIINGRVKVSITGHGGDQFVMAIWENGKCFGEGSLDTISGMPLEARALNDSMVLAIPHSVIETTLKEEGATFYRNLTLDMVERARDMYRLIEMLLFKPLHARLAARVLHFIDIYGELHEHGIVLPMKLSQSDLASMSGGSRQRVNQIFRKWADRGIITKPGRYYVVHDQCALQSILEATSSASLSSGYS